MTPKQDAFDSFVERHQGELLRLAYALTADRHGAQDLVQTTLIKVWVHWRSIRQEDPYGYARRVLIRDFSRTRRRRSASEIPVADPVIDGAAPGSSYEDHVLLKKVLLTLPPRARAVVVLRYREDLSERQTADLLNMSVGTVKSHGSRGLSALRAALGDPDLVLRGGDDD